MPHLHRAQCRLVDTERRAASCRSGVSYTVAKHLPRSLREMIELYGVPACNHPRFAHPPHYRHHAPARPPHLKAPQLLLERSRTQPCATVSVAWEHLARGRCSVRTRIVSNLLACLCAGLMDTQNRRSTGCRGVHCTSGAGAVLGGQCGLGVPAHSRQDGSATWYYGPKLLGAVQREPAVQQSNDQIPVCIDKRPRGHWHVRAIR